MIRSKTFAFGIAAALSVGVAASPARAQDAGRSAPARPHDAGAPRPRPATDGGAAPQTHRAGLDGGVATPAHHPATDAGTSAPHRAPDAAAPTPRPRATPGDAGVATAPRTTAGLDAGVAVARPRVGSDAGAGQVHRAGDAGAAVATSPASRPASPPPTTPPPNPTPPNPTPPNPTPPASPPASTAPPTVASPASPARPAGPTGPLGPAAPTSAQLVQRIQRAAAGNPYAAGGTIAGIILRGPPPAVVATGLDALAALARPEGAAAVSHALDNRHPLVRRHAVAAARAIHTPALVHELVGMLGDPDDGVRVDAAAALSEVGGRPAVAPLFAAFERDLAASSDPQGGRLMAAAAPGIGRFGGAEDLARVVAFLRRAPLRPIADAVRLAAHRRDLPEPARVQAVTAVGALGTAEVRQILEQIIADAHGQESAVTRAAATAVARIGD